jgi:predicted RND superfamily exporter protein
LKLKKLPKIYHLGLRYPGWVLAVALMLGVLSWHYAKGLVIETDFASLLPEKSEAVQNFRILNESFGSLGFLYATVESENKSSAQEFAKQFALSLESLPEIRFVEIDWPVEFFQKRKWLYLDLEDLKEMDRRLDRALDLAKEGVSPTFAPLMSFADEEDKPDLSFKDIRKKYEERFGKNFNSRQTFQDKDFIVLRIRPVRGSGSIDANKALMAQVEEVAAQLKKTSSFQNIKVEYAGPYIGGIETLRMIRSEILWISAIVFFVLNFILVLYCRRLSGAILIGLPLGLGILWAGGLIYLFLGHLNVVTGFGFSVLAGLGSDYGIFLLSRYFRERDEGKSHVEACHLAFAKTGRATWISMVVTVGSFVALMISGFQVFYEFGLVGAIGLVLNYLSMMVLMPSLLEIGERFKDHRWSRLLSWYPKEIKFSFAPLAGRIFKPSGPVWVVSLAVLVCLLSALTLPKQKRIYFEDGQFDTESLPSNQVYHRISEKFEESLSPTALIVQGSENERQLVRGLDRLLRETPKGELVFNKAIGLSSFIPENQGEKRVLLTQLVEKYRKHPLVLEKQKEKFASSIDQTLALSDVTEANLPVEVTRNFVAPNTKDTYLVAFYPAISRSDSENMKKYRDGLFAAREQIGVPFKPVDGALVGASIIDLINSEAGYGFGLLLLFFAGILFFATQNFKNSLLILAHLVGSLIVLSGTLYLLRIHLNILNIAVLPIILGTVVDCFIHFTERYQEEGDLTQTIQNEVSPILISTLTTIIGFGGFVFTSSWGLQSLGWVAVIGLTIVILFCTLVFPRALLLFSRPRAKVFSAREGLAEI